MKGIQQAEATANFILNTISNYKDFYFVISPLFRVQQYSSLICEHIKIDFKKCILEDLLKEHAFGQWEGLNEEIINDKYPEFIKRRYANWWEYVVPGGESYELIFFRATEFLVKYKDYENLIVITHEMISKVIRGKYLNLQQNEILKLDHSQNTIYKLSDSKITKFEIK